VVVNYLNSKCINALVNQKKRRYEMVINSERFPGVEWVGDTGDFIRIDKEKCDGCANCVRVCMGECFEIVKKRARIKSLDLCNECAACMYICHTDALTFSWPKGGTGFKFDWG
jgi:NAD-dependent dihydropyrimidine dehydrogenase PreA subunit